MRKSVTKIMKATVAFAVAIGASVGASFSSPKIGRVDAVTNNTEYSLINSVESLEAGKSYIITNGTSDTVKAIATTSNSNNRKTTDVTVSDGKITRGSSVMSFTLGGTSGAWTFATENYAGNAGYLASAASGSNNYLRVIATAGTATISFSDGAAVINIGPHESRTLIRYNPNNGSPMFACYSSGQQAIYLWKEVAGSQPQNTHNVIFNSNGGSNISSQQIEHGGFIDPLPHPTKSKDTSNKIRYEFEGWYANEGLTGNKFTTTTPVNGDVELFAKYTEIHYNVVTLNTNGGNSMGTKDVDVGNALPQPNDPYKDNYFFDGWYESPSFAGSKFDFSTVIVADVTLNAKWIDIPIAEAGKFVKITRLEDLVDGAKCLFVYETGSKAFDGNLTDLDSTPNTIDVVFDGDNIEKDENTNSAYFVIDKSNGYIKSASSYYVGRTSYSNGLDKARSTSSNYLNSIDFDGEGNVLVSRTFDGGTLTLQFNNTEGQKKFRYFKNAQEDVQLYMFVQGYVVTFVTNSASAIDPIEVLSGETIALPANPTKDPDASNTYTFEGWYTNEGLTVPFNPSTPITSNVTLYAKYDAEPVTNPNTYVDMASSLATIHGRENSNIQSGTDSIDFSTAGLNNGVEIADLSIGSVVLNGGQGTNGTSSNVPKYFDSGHEMRVYKGNTFTFESSTNITKIEFEFNASTGLTANQGSYSEGVWSGSEKSITFVNSNETNTQIKITSITITYGKQVVTVSDVAVRFGVSIAKSDWDAINNHDGWSITDYGVMFLKEATLNSYGESTVKAAFEADRAVTIKHKGSGEAPYLDGDNYLFTIKVSVPATYYGDVICAVPFIKVNDSYYFLEEKHESVNSLATYYRANGGSDLSNAALDYLKTAE